MLKKQRDFNSLVTQGIWYAVCILEIIFCYLYKYIPNQKLGEFFIFIAMLLLLFVIVGIFLTLVSLVYNIMKTVLSFHEQSVYRFWWLTWTVISPALYVALFFAVAVVFVEVTGGV